MKLKIKSVQVIEERDWSNLVEETYGRPYNFQQQDGCQARGTHNLTVPEDDNDEYMNDSVPEIVNHEEMGVKFAVWLARDPKQPLCFVLTSNTQEHTIFHGVLV